MQLLAILMAFFLAAAGLIHFGAPDRTADNPQMSVQEEIQHERMADIAAAELGDVWLEPEDVSPSVF